MAKVQKVEVFKIPMTSPTDVSGIVALIDDGQLHPKNIVAIIAKTEGNGLVNDFSRGLTELTLKVMHACFKKCFTVQGAPQPDRSQRFTHWQGCMGNVAADLRCIQIDVGKDHNAADRLFKYLSTPAGICSGVELFPINPSPYTALAEPLPCSCFIGVCVETD